MTFSHHDSRESGFTLIELLVVVVIVGVLAAALVIAVGATGERQLANASDRFVALLGHACDTAELSGREIGVAVSAEGYSFKRLDGDAWREFDSQDELRPRRWPTGLNLEFSRAGQPLDLVTPEHDTPQLVCFSSHELTPFALTLALGDGSARYRISGTDDVTIGVDKLGVRP